MISPAYQDHSALAAKLGVALRAGAVYEWVYDDHGHIVDVARDEQGRPKLLEVWDTIAPDPARPRAPPGSFAQAIRSRKLYYSGLGGRVVDDKRLFRILTSYAIPRDKDLAHPVESLSPFKLDLFYADPKAFVVKEPNNSGGSGIYFPRAMSSDASAKLVERVRASPEEFEVQHIATIATLKQASAEGEREVPIDLRLFVMMNAEGEVRAGPNSMLIRTGAEGGLYTNTSRGGGYGIGLVVDDEPISAHPAPSLPAAQVLPLSRGAERDELVAQSQSVLNCLGVADDVESCRAQALQLSFQFRLVLDLLDPQQVSVIDELRRFAHGGSVGSLSSSLRSAIARVPKL